MEKILAGIYQIQREIGSGGGGVVYEAWHLRLEKKVVVKEDRRGLYGRVEALRREADALKSLSHTYIPQVYDFVIEEGKVYTVMDFIEGESFDKLLKRGETFTQPQVVKWTRQLLEALIYLHSQPPYGILHGDIKPANVMLTPQGDIRLIDFNIALALGAEGAVAVGKSRGYASPEHYGIEVLEEVTGKQRMPIDQRETVLLRENGETIPLDSTPSSSGSSRTSLLDARSDIYSLGATIYHILSGIKPAAKATDVAPLSEAGFRGSFIQVIAKAMEPDPDKRYQSAQQMLKDLNSLHRMDIRYKRLYRVRRFMAATFSVLFLLSGFSSFIGLQRMERSKYMLVQAGYSEDALSRGDREVALSYALSAVSKQEGLLTPPSPAEGERALSNALGVYHLTDGYFWDHTLKLPSNPWKVTISENGKWGAVICDYQVFLFQIETMEVINHFPTVKSALADMEFIGDDLLIYAGEQGIQAYCISQNETLWQGKPATEIAVSQDGKMAAAVYKEEEKALVYSIKDGTFKEVSFQGKKQSVPQNDSFGNPEDLLLKLNQDGTLLAVSFADGSLDIFNLQTEEVIGIQPPSEMRHFEGGFYGDYFAFSAAEIEGPSVFAVVNPVERRQTGGFQSENPFGVLVDATGIYISSENLVVRLEPESGSQQEIAYLGKDVLQYVRDGDVFLVGTQDGGFQFFGETAKELNRYETLSPADFLAAAGGYALVGERDSQILRSLKRQNHQEAILAAYDPSYPHDEARIHEKNQRLLLFSYKDFQLWDLSGRLICESDFPDPERILDQQCSPESGNLAVFYPDAFRLYDGKNGGLLVEKTNLKSVFYAPYGASILEQDGTLSLIDLDSGNVLRKTSITGSFGAFCGMVVEEGFLQEKRLIGAGRFQREYLFAVSDGVACQVYDQEGNQRFSLELQGKGEAFFAEDWLVVAPQNGVPEIYDCASGKKQGTLHQDAYLAYVIPTEYGMVCDFVTAQGERYGLLLNESWEITAQFPDLTDIHGNQLFFDDETGSIRQSPIYNLTELICLAEEVSQDISESL